MRQKGMRGHPRAGLDSPPAASLPTSALGGRSRATPSSESAPQVGSTFHSTGGVSVARRQQPQVFSAQELKEWVGEEEPFPGIRRPARPRPFGVPWWRPDMLRMRLLAAWGVLVGRYDAVNWHLPRGAYLPLRMKHSTK